MLKLKELRQQYGLTQNKLAEKLNISRSTIAMYETNASEPDFATIEKIAELFNVSIDYLLGRETLEQPQKTGVKIPVLGTIPAGIPIEAIQDILDYEEISQEMASRGEYFALRVQGDSMLPTIKDGDVVIIKKQENADSGKICVVMINGFDATLKEIKKDTQGMWVLPHNANAEFKPTFFSAKEVDEVPVRIVGVAVEIRRSL